MIEAQDLINEPRLHMIDEIFAQCPDMTDQWAVHIGMKDCDHSGSGITFFQALANAYQDHLNMGDHT